MHIQLGGSGVALFRFWEAKSNAFQCRTPRGATIILFPIFCFSLLFLLCLKCPLDFLTFVYMMLCTAFKTQIQTWLRDYDRIQSFAVILIYVQVHFIRFVFLGINWWLISILIAEDWLCTDWISWGIIQRCFANQFGYWVIRIGRYWEQQSESW